MVVRDDDVEPALPGLGDLLHGRDPAVDGEDEADAVVREARQRLPRDAVAFLEPARQVPHDVGAELPEKEDGQRRRADAVDVVVAVYADPNPLRDGGADPADGKLHVSEQGRVVAGILGLEEPTRRVRLVVAAPQEDRRDDLADAERERQRTGSAHVQWCNRPGARHAP